MSKRFIIGIDPSLAATGWARTNGTTTTIKTKPGYGRLSVLHGQVCACIDLDVWVRPSRAIAVVEDLPANARSAGLTGMAQGVIRAELENWGVPYASVSPASLKKFATGDGRAGKDDMKAAMMEYNGHAPNDDNQVDAWWLRELGMQLENHPDRVDDDELFERARLAKLKGWPEGPVCNAEVA